MTTDRERFFGPSAPADVLMTATRRLMLAATTTALSDEELIHEAARMDQISARLEVGRTERMRRDPFTARWREEISAGKPWRMLPYNPLSIPQAITVVDGEARSDIALSAVHEGPPGMMHGGFGAAILDALLGSLVMVEVGPAVTAELTLYYRRPTPIVGTLQARGRVSEVSGRRIIAEGSLSHEGVETVGARGVFVTVPLP